MTWRCNGKDWVVVTELEHALFLLDVALCPVCDGGGWYHAADVGNSRAVRACSWCKHRHKRRERLRELQERKDNVKG